jgi:hypothetical protein
MVGGGGVGLGVGCGDDVGLTVALGVDDTAGNSLRVGDGTQLGAGNGVEVMPTVGEAGGELHEATMSAAATKATRTAG